MEFRILRGDIVSDISLGGLKIFSGPKLSTPIALAQLRELYLDPTRRAPFDILHDIGQGQFWQCRQEHVDVIEAQNALHDMYVHLYANLYDNFVYLLMHQARENLVSILCGPHAIKSMVNFT